MRKAITLICLATCMSSFAQWSKNVEFTGDANVYNLFEEVAKTERGIERYVALGVIDAQIKDESCPFEDARADYLPEQDYFYVHIGEDDKGNGEAAWKILQSKVWRQGNGDKACQRCYLGSVIINHSADEEYRNFYFYEYDPQTQILKSILKPFDVGYDDSELFYDLCSNGDIIVRRFGEYLCCVIYDGAEFRICNVVNEDME